MSRNVSGMMSRSRPSASWSSLISPAHASRVSYGRHSLSPCPVFSQRGMCSVDRRLRLGDGARQVASAHAELDRTVAHAVFAVDHRRALRRPDVGDLAERDRRPVGRGDGDLANRLEAHSILRLPSNRQVEELLALVDLRDRLTADRRLDDRVHVARVQAVARALLAQRRDLDVRLPERTKEAEVGDAGHLAHHVGDAVRQRLVSSRGPGRRP